MFVAELDEIEQTTWSGTLEGIMSDLSRMVLEYFLAIAKAGLLAETLARLGASPIDNKLQVSLHVEIGRDALPELPADSSTSLDTNLTVPVAA